MLPNQTRCKICKKHLIYNRRAIKYIDKLKYNGKVYHTFCFNNVVKKLKKNNIKLLRAENGVNKDYKTQKDVEGIWLYFEEDGI